MINNTLFYMQNTFNLYLNQFKMISFTESIVSITL